MSQSIKQIPSQEVKEEVMQTFAAFIKPDHADYFLLESISKAIDRVSQAIRAETEREHCACVFKHGVCERVCKYHVVFEVVRGRDMDTIYDNAEESSNEVSDTHGNPENPSKGENTK